MNHFYRTIPEPTSPSPHAADCMAQIRDILANRKEHGNLWAKEIMSKIAAGEKVTPAAYDLAKAALAKAPSREPGSDDEEITGDNYAEN